MRPDFVDLVWTRIRPYPKSLDPAGIRIWPDPVFVSWPVGWTFCKPEQDDELMVMSDDGDDDDVLCHR